MNPSTSPHLQIFIKMKERVQSGVEGKDLELKLICYFGLRDTGMLCIILSYCAQEIYGIVSTALRSKFLLHISIKNITKMHNLCHLR